MAITDIPILSMLRTRLNWNQERQKVLSQNVANSDTPNYRGRDLVPPKFEDPTAVTARPLQMVSLAKTDAGHIGTGALSGTSYELDRKGNFNVSPTGNSVSLEDEMMKVASNQMEYQAATALYSRSLNLLKVGLGKR